MRSGPNALNLKSGASDYNTNPENGLPIEVSTLHNRNSRGPGPDFFADKATIAIEDAL